jgi:hypothetical protein
MHGEPEKEIECILGLDRRIILKWILKNRVGVHFCIYLLPSTDKWWVVVNVSVDLKFL